jgi:hypothetical protein
LEKSIKNDKKKNPAIFVYLEFTSKIAGLKNYTKKV